VKSITVNCNCCSCTVESDWRRCHSHSTCRTPTEAKRHWGRL